MRPEASFSTLNDSPDSPFAAAYARSPSRPVGSVEEPRGDSQPTTKKATATVNHLAVKERAEERWLRVDRIVISCSGQMCRVSSDQTTETARYSHRAEAVPLLGPERQIQSRQRRP